MAETLVYLSDYSDEVMPCAPTLKAWASWLAAPDPDWNRPHAAQDGDTFGAWANELLGDVRADWTPDGWRLTPEPPAGSTYFYCRWHEGSEGWNVEMSGATPAEALEEAEADDGAVWLACVSADRRVHVRFNAEGPRCVIVGAAQ